MHIAYLHYLFGDDTATHHVRQFSDAARGLGHRVDVYAMNLANQAAPNEEAAAGAASPMASPTAGQHLRAFLKRHFSRYLHEPKELLWNFRYAQLEKARLTADRPDVLLVRDHTLTASCVTVARQLDLPLVLEVNAPAAESRLYLDEYFHLPWVSEALEARKLRRANAVTVVSTALRDHLVDEYRLPPEKFTVVPNGADLERFHPQLQPDPQIPDHFHDGVVIGFVGSFEKWHGSDLLAQMARQVGAARPQTCFLFVGDGPEAPRLRQATAELGDRVLFTGRVDHRRVPGLVAGFDIGVVAEAAFYMSPLKVIEWMAAERAVVAPAYGPLKELMDPGEEGLLFPPRDGGAMADSLIRLVDQPDLRQKLAAAAARRAHRSLSWTDNARRVLEACESAIHYKAKAHRTNKGAGD